MQDRHIKGAAAQVVYHILALRTLLQAVSNCSRGRFIEQPQYMQPCEPRCILGCLSLSIVKIRGDSNHCARARSADKISADISTGFLSPATVRICTMPDRSTRS